MIDGAGLALVCGALALYACDASLLLFRDEVVFTRGHRGWRGTLGGGFLLGGRYLVMPGVWLPGLAVFRACWSAQQRRTRAQAPLRALLRALRPLQWAVRVLALLLFVALPSGLFLHAGPAWMLAWVVALYGIAMACVAWTWRCRRVFGLDGKRFALFAFDVLACPPFAVNLVMKLTLRQALPLSPGNFARRVLSPVACADLLRDADARMHPGALHEETAP